MATYKRPSPKDFGVKIGQIKDKILADLNI